MARVALTHNREKHSAVRDVGELVKRLESRKRTRRSVVTPDAGPGAYVTRYIDSTRASAEESKVTGRGEKRATGNEKGTMVNTGERRWKESLLVHLIGSDFLRHA